MSRSARLGALFAVTVTLLVLGLAPNHPLGALFHPLRRLLGLSAPVRLDVLEIPDDSNPVTSAARRLIQPFGAVRLVHIYEAKEKTAAPPVQR